MKFKKNQPIQEIIQFSGPLISDTLGDLDMTVSHFSTIEMPLEGSFAFINNPRLIPLAETSSATCLLAPDSYKSRIEEMSSNKTWLFSPNVNLAARNIKNEFVFSTPYRADIKEIHATAVIDPSVEMALGVVVGPYAVIGKNVKIGEGTYIGAGAVIEENVIIKGNTTIHPQAYIGHSCEVGHHCEIMPSAVVGSEGYGYSHDHHGNHYRIPHTGKVILHDDVHIGAGAAIDRGTIEDTVVGEGTKIDNQVHLAHNTKVGRNGLITAQVVTAGSSTIGDNFVAGGKTAIAGHIKVTDNVNVAGYSAISNNVTEPGQYGGYPLLPLKKHLKVRASSVHLPELRKQMNRVLRKLFPEDFEN